MAPSYDPADAYSMITPQLGNVSLDATMKGTWADNAQNWLWNLWPWHWTRKVLPNITLVNATQDYTGANLPSDFGGQLLDAACLRTDTTPDHRWDIDVKRWLPLDPQATRFPVRAVAFHGELNSQAGGFRVLPNPAISGGTVAVITGTYKMNPATKYTSANLTTNFVELPDRYFHVYQEVLLWLVYRGIGDERAGTAQWSSRDRMWIYTGQIGVVMGMVETMLRAEDVADTETIFPENPLGYYKDFSGTSLL